MEPAYLLARGDSSPRSRSPGAGRGERFPSRQRLVCHGVGPNRSRQQSSYDLDSKIFVVDRVTKELREVLALPGESAMAPALTADGTRLYFVRSGFESDIWMLSPTGPGDSREPR